jgi:hypothetical protein
MKTAVNTKVIFSNLKNTVGVLALTGVLLSPLASAYGATGTAVSNPVTAKAEKQTDQNTQAKLSEKRQEINAEALSALNETRNGLKALDDNKKDEALGALERATGKLEIILARDPKLALAPVGASAATYDLYADTKTVMKARKEAEAMLREGRVQDARLILSGLASETVISVSNLPLATYPAAIKEAVRLIDSGKNDEAKAVLQTALNTLVITPAVIPLPVVRAQNLLKDAEKLAEQKNRKSEDNKKLTDLLTMARTDIDMAQALGYGTPGQFKSFYAELDKISEETGDGKSGTGFFEKIKSAMTAMVDKANTSKAAVN